jgi:RsiW-degrading membrane proteinase PrsW (M82 family)
MGPDLLIALLVLFLGIGVPLWAVIDAANRPAAAFYGAGSNKTAWIAVIVVAFFLGIGFLLGGFYLLFTRPKVRRQMGSLRY